MPKIDLEIVVFKRDNTYWVAPAAPTHIDGKQVIGVSYDAQTFKGVPLTLSLPIDLAFARLNCFPVDMAEARRVAARLTQNSALFNFTAVPDPQVSETECAAAAPVAPPAKPEYALVTGKNGNRFIRRRSGDALALFQWNTRTGEPENDSAFTERVYHLLRLFEGVTDEELARASRRAPGALIERIDME